MCATSPLCTVVNMVPETRYGSTSATSDVEVSKWSMDYARHLSRASVAGSGRNRLSRQTRSCRDCRTSGWTECRSRGRNEIALDARSQETEAASQSYGRVAQRGPREQGQQSPYRPDPSPRARRCCGGRRSKTKMGCFPPAPRPPGPCTGGRAKSLGKFDRPLLQPRRARELATGTQIGPLCATCP